jgi:hypothetical protein
MNCKCKYCSAVLAIVVLVFSFWQVAWTSWLTSKWIIVAAAVLILLHGVSCHYCNDGSCKVTKAPMKRKARRVARRKKRR